MKQFTILIKPILQNIQKPTITNWSKSQMTEACSGRTLALLADHLSAWPVLWHSGNDTPHHHSAPAPPPPGHVSLCADLSHQMPWTTITTCHLLLITSAKREVLDCWNLDWGFMRSLFIKVTTKGISMMMEVVIKEILGQRICHGIFILFYCWMFN